MLIQILFELIPFLKLFHNVVKSRIQARWSGPYNRMNFFICWSMGLWLGAHWILQSLSCYLKINLPRQQHDTTRTRNNKNPKQSRVVLWFRAALTFNSNAHRITPSHVTPRGQESTCRDDVSQRNYKRDKTTKSIYDWGACRRKFTIGHFKFVGLVS